MFWLWLLLWSQSNQLCVFECAGARMFPPPAVSDKVTQTHFRVCGECVYLFFISFRNSKYFWAFLSNGKFIFMFFLSNSCSCPSQWSIKWRFRLKHCNGDGEWWSTEHENLNRTCTELALRFHGYRILNGQRRCAFGVSVCLLPPSKALTHFNATRTVRRGQTFCPNTNQFLINFSP